MYLIALKPDDAQIREIWLSYICFVVSKGYPRWIALTFSENHNALRNVEMLVIHILISKISQL